MAFGIRLCTGLEEGELYPLFENREIPLGRSPTNNLFILGRSPTNNLFIRDKNVSRVHSQIVVTNGVCTLTDLQSTNGTFVNGEKVTECQLKAGDEVRVGTTLLRCEEVDDQGRAITDTALMG